MPSPVTVAQRRLAHFFSMRGCMDEFMVPDEDADMADIGLYFEEKQVPGLQLIQSHFFCPGQLRT